MPDIKASRLQRLAIYFPPRTEQPKPKRVRNPDPAVAFRIEYNDKLDAEIARRFYSRRSRRAISVVPGTVAEFALVYDD